MTVGRLQAGMAPILKFLISGLMDQRRHGEWEGRPEERL